jgi:TonB family protein
MLEQTTRREAGTNAGPSYNRDRSRLSLALALLLVALVVLVVKDRDFWFGDSDASVAEETTPEWIPNKVFQTPTPAALPAAQPKTHIISAKTAAAPATTLRPVIATNRTSAAAVIPPLEVEVIAGETRNTPQLGSKALKIEMAPDSRSGATDSKVAERGPATVAAERVQMSLAKAQIPPQASESPYPLLGRQMKVQGSVLLQALIGADGMIRDLRVLNGPAILASAAREAARGWQFKPYLQNGQPVETQAKITVNFTIKVLENGARDETDTVVALSRGGE